MIVAALASGMLFFATKQSVDVTPKEAGAITYAQVATSDNGYTTYYHQPDAVVTPLSVHKFRGVVRQAYDYSCGSAALTTLLNGTLGTNLTERQTMNGLLNYGERDRIIERRSFSLLDMKRFVSALGVPSGGFKATFEELSEIQKPVIVLISYGGFDHFVVYKGTKDGRVFVADPALGNISFMRERFIEVWDKTLFMLEPDKEQASQNLLTIDDEDMRVVDDATVNYYAFQQFSQSIQRQEQLRDLATTIQPVADSDPDSETFGDIIDVPLRLYYNRQ